MNRFCLSELGTSLNNGSDSKPPFGNFSCSGPRRAARAGGIGGALVREAGAASNLLAATFVPALVTAGCGAAIAGAEVDPPGGAVEADDAAASLLLSAFEPLVPRWITRFNLKTIPD